MKILHPLLTWRWQMILKNLLHRSKMKLWRTMMIRWCLDWPILYHWISQKLLLKPVFLKIFWKFWSTTFTLKRPWWKKISIPRSVSILKFFASKNIIFYFCITVPTMNSTFIRFVSKNGFFKSLTYGDQSLIYQENLHLLIHFCFVKYQMAYTGFDQLSWLMMTNTSDIGIHFRKTFKIFLIVVMIIYLLCRHSRILGPRLWKDVFRTTSFWKSLHQK